MKKVFNSLIFTVIIAFLTCCYAYFNTSPFKEKKLELNTSDYEILNKSIENIQDSLDERQNVYDDLKNIAENLALR